MPWCKSFHHAPGNQRIVRGAAQTARGELKTVQKTAEIRKCPDAIDLLAGECRIEHQDRFRVDRSLQM